MENEKLDRDVRATIKKNWKLFKQSRLGMTGLGIVIFFWFFINIATYIVSIWRLG